MFKFYMRYPRRSNVNAIELDLRTSVRFFEKIASRNIISIMARAESL